MMYFLWQREKIRRWFENETIFNNCKEKHKNVDYRIITCIDCGKTVKIPKSSKTTKRCSECQAIEVRRQERERKRQQRAKNK